MDYKKLIVRGISYSQTQSGAYALILEETETSVKLPLIIGGFEAQSISLGLEKDLEISRPLTHDLFVSFIKRTSFQMTSVLIYKLIEGVFYSNIYFENKDTNEEMVLDSRTSDAVAMALRFDVPIYTTQKVLDEAGILLDLEPDTGEVSDDTMMNFSKLSVEELEMLLEKAVKDENFDLALELQKEIKERNKPD